MAGSLVQFITTYAQRNLELPPPLVGTRFYARAMTNQRKPVIYPPSLILVAQGAKCAYYQGQELRYDPSQFLILTAPLPVECQVVEASQDKPYLACALPLDLGILTSLAMDLELPRSRPSQQPSSISVTTANDSIWQAATRLLGTFADPQELRALAPGHLRELYFHLLRSPQGEVLLGFLNRADHGQSLARVLAQIHAQIGENFSVEDLAAECGLSSSAFHRAFKSYTGHSPGQYIKSMKIHKAYSAMHYDRLTVGEAAALVGYQSASQFSREFKRAFGKTPSELLRQARQD